MGDVSHNGNVNLSTPNIDRLARGGAQLARFYVSPVCSPTRSEFLTGRYHPRSGVTAMSGGRERMDLDETTIAEVFRDDGYATGAFGKWHNGSQPPCHPNARGFDEFYGFTSGHWGDYFSPPLESNGEIVRGQGFVADDMTDKALAFMEERRDRPFLVYVPYDTPHSPMQVPDRFRDKFAGHPLGMRHRDPDRENVEHTRTALAMVENVDWNAGRILDGLERLGLEDDTVVLYFSDNGPNGARWNGDMKGRKGSTDEGGVRSPFVIRWPGRIAPETTVDRIATAIDLLPTLAELAGVGLETNHPVDGASFAPLLTGEGTAEPKPYVFSHWRGRTSVRSRRFRLDHDGMLFDMIADPGQRTDVGRRHPDALQAMMAARAAWMDDVLSEAEKQDRRPFTVGHPEFALTQLPARDATASGGIERSNRYPNDSFFHSWMSADDAVAWNVEILADGRYEATIHYTCREGDEGSLVELRFGAASVSARIAQAHDPPLAARGRNGFSADDGWERIQTRARGVVVHEAGFPA